MKSVSVPLMVIYLISQFVNWSHSFYGRDLRVMFHFGSVTMLSNNVMLMIFGIITTHK